MGYQLPAPAPIAGEGSKSRTGEARVMHKLPEHLPSRFRAIAPALYAEFERHDAKARSLDRRLMKALKANKTELAPLEKKREQADAEYSALLPWARTVRAVRAEKFPALTAEEKEKAAEALARVRAIDDQLRKSRGSPRIAALSKAFQAAALERDAIEDRIYKTIAKNPAKSLAGVKDKLEHAMVQAYRDGSVTDLHLMWLLEGAIADLKRMAAH
jgi:hypothetical protein